MYELKNKIKILDPRSRKVALNAILSAGIKIINITTTMAVIPVTLHYLNAGEYGIWLTLSSVLAWISIFDVGLGNGLRNRLAEALAQDDLVRAREYVSTTMVLLAGIVGILFLTFLVVNPFLEWSRILNAPAGLSSQLALVATVVLACLSFQFVLKIVGTVMMAKQRSWVNDSMVAMANVASLGALILLTHLKPQGTLLSVALVYSIVPVVISIFIGLWFFLGEFSDLRPSFALVRLQYTKDLMGIGVQFFVIQIVGLVVYMSSSLLITQLSSPENVVKYNIAYRYLSPLNMAFTIVLTPLWSAYTDAYHRGDHAWIAKTLKRTGQMALLFGLGGIVMVLASGWVYRVWIGKGVEIPYLLTLALALFFALSNVVGVAVMFLNGIGKLRIQLWAGVLSALIHIPLSILLVRHIGFSGVAWSMVAVTMFSTALTYIQLHRILNGSAKGIWIQ